MTITSRNSTRMKGGAEKGPVKGSMMHRNAGKPSNDKILSDISAGGNTSATDAGKIHASTTQPGQEMMVRALRKKGPGILGGGTTHGDDRRGTATFSGEPIRHQKQMARPTQKNPAKGDAAF